MAHYMPWYQTPAVSGYWGWHWTMEHFNPNRKDENDRPTVASYYLPLTGPYDSSDETLLEYQVLLMRLAGIDGVIVDSEGVWDRVRRDLAAERAEGLLSEAELKLTRFVEVTTREELEAAYTDQTAMLLLFGDAAERETGISDRPVLDLQRGGCRDEREGEGGALAQLEIMGPGAEIRRRRPPNRCRARRDDFVEPRGASCDCSRSPYGTTVCDIAHARLAARETAAQPATS